MGIPNVGDDTPKSVSFAAEVGGRAQGVAAMTNLVPDGDKRAGLERSGAKIVAVAREAATAYVTRFLAEFFDSRIAWGKGRGVDRGFDAGVAAIGEKARTSLPDRNTANPEYRAIFKDGTTAEYTTPAIKQDPDLAATLRRGIEASGLSAKTELLGMLDPLMPLVEAAAGGVRGAEEQVNHLFEVEMAARKKLVDVMWEERKTIEQLLGRGGRGVARFIFFDFRSPATPEAAPVAPPVTTPAAVPAVR